MLHCTECNSIEVECNDNGQFVCAVCGTVQVGIHEEHRDAEDAYQLMSQRIRKNLQVSSQHISQNALGSQSLQNIEQILSSFSQQNMAVTSEDNEDDEWSNQTQLKSSKLLTPSISSFLSVYQQALRNLSLQLVERWGITPWVENEVRNLWFDFLMRVQASGQPIQSRLSTKSIIDLRIMDPQIYFDVPVFVEMNASKIAKWKTKKLKTNILLVLFIAVLSDMGADRLVYIDNAVQNLVRNDNRMKMHARVLKRKKMSLMKYEFEEEEETKTFDFSNFVFQEFDDKGGYNFKERTPSIHTLLSILGVPLSRVSSVSSENPPTQKRGEEDNESLDESENEESEAIQNEYDNDVNRYCSSLAEVSQKYRSSDQQEVEKKHILLFGEKGRYKLFPIREIAMRRRLHGWSEQFSPEVHLSSTLSDHNFDNIDIDPHDLESFNTFYSSLLSSSLLSSPPSPAPTPLSTLTSSHLFRNHISSRHAAVILLDLIYESDFLVAFLYLLLHIIKKFPMVLDILEKDIDWPNPSLIDDIAREVVQVNCSALALSSHGGFRDDFLLHSLPLSVHRLYPSLRMEASLPSPMRGLAIRMLYTRLLSTVINSFSDDLSMQKRERIRREKSEGKEKRSKEDQEKTDEPKRTVDTKQGKHKKSTGEKTVESQKNQDAEVEIIEIDEEERTEDTEASEEIESNSFVLDILSKVVSSAMIKKLSYDWHEAVQIPCLDHTLAFTLIFGALRRLHVPIISSDIVRWYQAGKINWAEACRDAPLWTLGKYKRGNKLYRNPSASFLWERNCLTVKDIDNTIGSIKKLGLHMGDGPSCHGLVTRILHAVVLPPSLKLVVSELLEQLASVRRIADALGGEGEERRTEEKRDGGKGKEMMDSDMRRESNIAKEVSPVENEGDTARETEENVEEKLKKGSEKEKEKKFIQSKPFDFAISIFEELEGKRILDIHGAESHYKTFDQVEAVRLQAEKVNRNYKGKSDKEILYSLIKKSVFPPRTLTEATTVANGSGYCDEGIPLHAEIGACILIACRMLWGVFNEDPEWSGEESAREDSSGDGDEERRDDEKKFCKTNIYVYRNATYEVSDEEDEQKEEKDLRVGYAVTDRKGRKVDRSAEIFLNKKKNAYSTREIGPLGMKIAKNDSSVNTLSSRWTDKYFQEDEIRGEESQGPRTTAMGEESQLWHNPVVERTAKEKSAARKEGELRDKKERRDQKRKVRNHILLNAASFLHSLPSGIEMFLRARALATTGGLQGKKLGRNCASISNLTVFEDLSEQQQMTELRKLWSDAIFTREGDDSEQELPLTSTLNRLIHDQVSTSPLLSTTLSPPATIYPPSSNIHRDGVPHSPLRPFPQSPSHPLHTSPNATLLSSPLLASSSPRRGSAANKGRPFLTLTQLREETKNATLRIYAKRFSKNKLTGNPALEVLLPDWLPPSKGERLLNVKLPGTGNERKGRVRKAHSTHCLPLSLHIADSTCPPVPSTYYFYLLYLAEFLSLSPEVLHRTVMICQSILSVSFHMTSQIHHEEKQAFKSLMKKK